MKVVDADPLRTFRAEDGTRLAFRAHYCGRPGAPALVMVHGVGSNGTRFTELSARTRLRSSWDLLRPDLRGHGGSLCRGLLTREIWSRDLVSLLDAEGRGAAVFMGHSLGAQVAMDLAAAYPGRVRGLILVDPVFPETLRGVLALVRRLAPMNRVAIRLLGLTERMGLQRRTFPYRDLYALDLRTRSLLDAGRSRGIVRLYMNPRADLRYLPLRNYLQDLREVVRAVPDPATIPVPVLILRSEGASVSDADRSARLLSRFPAGERVDIDADHWLLTERPAEARAAIERWCLARVPESG